MNLVSNDFFEKRKKRHHPSIQDVYKGRAGEKKGIKYLLSRSKSPLIDGFKKKAKDHNSQTIHNEDT